MKRWKQVMSLILVLVLAVYGLPVFPSAQAVITDDGLQSAVYSAEAETRATDGGESTAQELPTTRMRFVQTGFDSSTGILTMSLQIKPDPGTRNETVSEGVFTFQTSASTVVPVTRQTDDRGNIVREPIRAYSDVAAVVTTTDATTPLAMQEFLKDSSRSLRIPLKTTLSFAKTMGTTDFATDKTGFLVSTARRDAGLTKMLDCYFQFYISWNQAPTNITEDGYVNVMDFDFQCYAGLDDDGNSKPATSVDCLFSGSIQVPQTREEAQEILDQFYYVNSAGEKVPMAMGGAGFIQKYKTTRYAEGNAYYYYDEPVMTKWRGADASGNTIREVWSKVTEAQPVVGENAPGVWYENMNEKYIVRGLVASCNNTFRGDTMPDPNNPDKDIYITNPDFELPTDSNGRPLETGVYPRYVIPTYEQAQENDRTRNWLPEAYQKSSRQALKYYIGTETAVNSTSSPEHEDFEAFLAELKWEFVLSDGRSLEDVEITTESGDGKLIPTVDGKQYRVKLATITDSRYTGTDFEGVKLWEVFWADDPEDPSKDRYFMRTPVGVTMDMQETQVEYDDPFENPDRPQMIDDHAIAPQLHITNEAADPDSYIWHNQYTGQVLFRPVYDPDGAAYKDQWITTRLYRNTATPTYVELDKGDIPDGIETASGGTETGFWAGNTNLDGSGTESVYDAVSSKALTVYASLLDQYYIPFKDRWTTVELTPADGSETPFQAVQVTEDGKATNAYTIIYKTGMDANNVKEGRYILKASYASPRKEASLELCVRKPADKLTCLETRLTGFTYIQDGEAQDVEASEENPVPGTIIKVNCTVPTLRNGTASTSYGNINISELANQWRVVDNPAQTASDYDIVSGIRNSDTGFVDLAKARNAGVRFDFELEYPDGQLDNKLLSEGVLSVQNIREKGSFSFNSGMPANYRFNCRVTATYGGYSRFVEYQFNFTRELQTLSSIAINPPSLGETKYEIRVPLKTEDPATQYLSVVALDQYGSVWNWAGVEEAYAPGGRLNPKGTQWPEWRVYPYPANQELPEGVSLGGDHYATVTVSPGAPSCEFQVYARFAGSQSKPMRIVVERETSIPNTVRNLTYNNGTNEIPSPDRYNPNDSVSYTPSIEVFDQYEDEITEYDDAKWTITVTPAEASSYVHIDRTTGVLSVDRYAPNCTVAVKAQITKGGKRKTTESEITIKRDRDRPIAIEVEQDEKAYPSSADAGMTTYQLTATGETQYGVPQPMDKDSLLWYLDAVEFADGAILYRVDPTTQANTGDIVYDRNTYSARNSVQLTDTGLLNFNSVTMERDVPVAVTVTVRYGNGVSGTKRIKITREASYPDRLFFPVRDDYQNGVQVPTVGKTTEVSLEVYVRDQYGIIMSESVAPVTWEYQGTPPVGFSVDTGKRIVTINSDAQEGSSVNIAVKCGKLESSLSISARQDQPLVVGSVEVTGIRDSEGNLSSGKDNLVIDLPAMVGTGYDAYTLYCNVRSQFGGLLTRGVKWSAEGPEGVKVVVTDASAGILRVYFTPEVRNNLKNSGGSGQEFYVTIKAASEDDPTKSDTANIYFTLAAPVPSYAVPEIVSYGEGAEEQGGVMKALVPQKGEAPTEVLVRATVYDQYGWPMENEAADISCTLLQGLSLKQTENTNNATLYIGPTVPVLTVMVQATPKGMPNALQEESDLAVNLNKGTAYAYELKVPNTYEFDIPLWDSRQDSKVPGADSTEIESMRAEVVDQYDVWMSADSDLYHPIWEFVGEHDGVEFASGKETEEGEDVEISITNRAIPVGQMEKTVKLRLHTTNAPEDSYFSKEITVRLVREPARATYMFIDGSNEKGVDEDGLWRPYAEDGSKIYEFSPVVYDQYGIPMEGEPVDMDMDLTPLEERDDLLVEKVYNQGESEENGDTPIGYAIYRVEYTEPDEEGVVEESSRTLLAEFDRATGYLKVYTDCTSSIIDSFSLTADYGPLGKVGKKGLVVLLNEEDLRPYQIEVNRTHGDFILYGNEKENINDYIRPLIYDQYGKPYSGSVSVRWALLLPQKDQNGDYLNYDSELDEDGVQRFPEEFLVLKSDSGDGATTITVQPQQYYEDKTVILRCLVIDNLHPDRDHWVMEYTDINVRYGRRYISTDVIIDYDAGQYGKLVGPSQWTINAGEAPTALPGVKTVTGYGFMGWTSDGEQVVDPTQIALFGNTTYVAVYRDVTTTQFLSGYKDGTIRPEIGVTRAEFITMIARAFGGYDPEIDYGSSFPDVSADRWYSNYIAFAKSNGIAKGYPDGTFRPNNVITRAEAAQLLATATKLKAGDNWSTFKDVDPGAWYARSVSALYEAGVASGYEDGTFRPARKITRAEAVRLILMLTVNAPNELELENIRKYAYCPFIDVKRTHWAYPYILRAAGVA